MKIATHLQVLLSVCNLLPSFYPNIITYLLELKQKAIKSQLTTLCTHQQQQCTCPLDGQKSGRNEVTRSEVIGRSTTLRYPLHRSYCRCGARHSTSPEIEFSSTFACRCELTIVGCTDLHDQLAGRGTSHYMLPQLCHSQRSGFTVHLGMLHIRQRLKRFLPQQ